MKTIKGSEKVKSESKENILESYGFISRLEYSIKIDMSDKINCIVNMKLLDNMTNPTSEMDITFSGVQGLMISNEGNVILQSSGFAILNIQDFGWEHISWEFFDYEHSTVFFYASEVEIVSELHLS